MQQLLLVLKKCKIIIFGLIFILNLPYASTQLDLKQEMNLLNALSDAVANFKDEEQGITKYFFGALKNYEIDSYKEEYYAGGMEGYDTSNNSISTPVCCELVIFTCFWGSSLSNSRRNFRSCY